MMPLGDQLRADDDVDAAFGDLVQFAAHDLERGDQVARQHHGARLRKQRGDLFLQPLDARADGDQRLLGLTLRTGMRPRHREAAVMTDQPLAKAVIDQPRIADVAGKAVTAGAAQRQRRIAAPIEEQQRLLAPLDRLQDRFLEPRRDELAALRPLDAQVDRLDLRHVLPAEALTAARCAGSGHGAH